MTTVAGVLVVTAPGRGPSVAAKLVSAPGLTLAGGDGDSRVAVVWEGSDGASLEALAGRLLAEDPEVLGVFPTFVGEDEEV